MKNGLKFGGEQLAERPNMVGKASGHGRGSGLPLLMKARLFHGGQCVKGQA
jgi:hypothetical protein